MQQSAFFQTRGLVSLRLAVGSAVCSPQHPARQGSSSSKVQSWAGAVARQELQHALNKVRRVRGGKMGGGWLLAFLGLLAVAHGEIFGSVGVLIIQEKEQFCLIPTKNCHLNIKLHWL